MTSKIQTARKKAFDAAVASSDLASHTAINVALDTFIKEMGLK